MLKGLGQIGDMARMMKAAQEMQGKMAEMQAGLDALTVEAQSGGGLVRAVATAKGELRSLSIDPSIFKAEDREMVEDLIVAAVRDVQAKAAERVAAEVQKLSEAMGLPPGMMGA